MCICMCKSTYKFMFPPWFVDMAPKIRNHDIYTIILLPHSAQATSV